MNIVCTASFDTYITNKIINGSIVATDANVGRAGTLDIFKLYDETTLSGVSSQLELSRALLKFDLQPLYDLTSSIADINSPNFKAYLQLFDIAGGNFTPANFDLIVFPLSQSFDEGVGRDTGFNDLDRANWITASYSTTNNLWFSSGADAGGLLGSNNIDYISSGNLGAGIVNLFATQKFVKGTEDMSVDITTILSATLAGKIPDLGFRISFSGSQETDQKTRFVKRFASRQSANALIRPKILVKFDNNIQDSSNDFNFDTSGTIFLNNYNDSSLANIVSGSSLTPVTGLNCLMLTLNTGSFNFVVTGSQYRAGTGDNFVEGVYSASFAISSVDSTPVTGVISGSVTLENFIAASGSVTFTTFWSSLDGTFGFHTGSLKIKRPVRQQGSFSTRRPILRINNGDPYYTSGDTVRFRVFGGDLEYQFNEPVRRNRKLRSFIYDKVYYQVIDRNSGNIIIPYDTVNDSTRLSTDDDGMFFDFKMQALLSGRTYGFRFLIVERGQSYLSIEDDTCFDVRP